MYRWTFSVTHRRTGHCFDERTVFFGLDLQCFIYCFILLTVMRESCRYETEIHVVIQFVDLSYSNEKGTDRSARLIVSLIQIIS